MNMPCINQRCPETDVDSMFYDRFSPRSFRSDSIPDYQIKGLFEAAKWAPSCYNEQPWLFLCAVKEDDRDLFLRPLVAQNRKWAEKAPLLLYVCAKKNFSQSGEPNNHAVFDAGAAWLSLALQARKFGLYAHAMAGFDKEEAYKLLHVPEAHYHIIAAIAVGRNDDPEKLEDDTLIALEKANNRKALHEIYIEGVYHS